MQLDSMKMRNVVAIFCICLRIYCSGEVTVNYLSVPEDHTVCLQCHSSSNSSDVMWTLQDRKVLVVRRGGPQADQNPQRYFLHGRDLCILQLDDSDDGAYRCDQELVADLQVLKGSDFKVPAGRTLLLPCRGSTKPKQRWFLQVEGGKREVIYTHFKNGTGKPEQEENCRLGYSQDALEIRDLRLEDAGEYLCNGIPQGKVSVLPAFTEQTSVSSFTSPLATSASFNKDVDGVKQSSENVLLLMAVVGLGLTTVAMASICIFLITLKCRGRKRKYKASQKYQGKELELWSTPNPKAESDEEIHYASLGRHNWKERLDDSSSTNPGGNVIYSSVITRPSSALHLQTFT